MTDKKPKTDKKDEHIAELTADLQRVRADFENYRKRMETEKAAAQANGETKAILKLIPVIDTIDRAIVTIPNDIAKHQWVQGVAGLIKQLDKALADMNLQRIDATPSTVFNPEFHQAVQFDDEAKGEKEVIEEELQPGYTLNGSVIRPSLVKVTKQ